MIFLLLQTPALLNITAQGHAIHKGIQCKAGYSNWTYFDFKISTVDSRYLDFGYLE